MDFNDFPGFVPLHAQVSLIRRERPQSAGAGRWPGLASKFSKHA